MNRMMRPSAWERETLMNLTLLAALERETLAAMLEIATVRTIGSRQMLFREGDPADTMYCVLSGYVRTFHLAPQGREVDLLVHEPGDLVGASACMHGDAYCASAQATDSVKIVQFNLARVRELAARKSDLALALASGLSGQFAGSLSTLADDRLHTAPQRVALYLKKQCPQGAHNVSFRLPYQKNLLAGKLGLAPEALSRAFSHLKHYGVNVRGRLVQVSDPEALQSV
jgi:CRP-like cAMP-binding protein